MATPSGFFKFVERADEAFKKKNFEYAIDSYLEALRLDPENGETRKKLLKTCRERKLAGQAKASALDGLALMPRKKALTGIAGGAVLALVFFLALPSGAPNPDVPDDPGGLPLDWILSLPALAATGAFAFLSPWPRLLLWKKQGKARQGFDLTQKLLLKDPDSIDLLEAHAEMANLSGAPEAAIAVCEWTLSFLPDHVPTLHLLGALMHQHRKDIPKAQQIYGRILHIHPTDLQASRVVKNLAAEMTMSQGVEAAATGSDYRKMIKDTKTAQKLEDQQRTLKTADEVERAVAYKKEELEKKPDDWRLWRDLGDLEARLKAWDRAEEAYRKAIALEPVNPTLKMSLGNLAFKKFDERILALKTAIKADPAGAEAKGRLAQVEKERTAFAVEEYAWRAKEHPTDPNIRFEHGEALYRAGRTREAIGEFQFSVKDLKRKTMSLLRLGECFRREGQIDLSVKQYERALEDLTSMNEAKKAVLYALGDAYEKQERLADAKKAWDELYEADINFRDIPKRLEALNARIKGQAPGP